MVEGVHGSVEDAEAGEERRALEIRFIPDVPIAPCICGRSLPSTRRTKDAISSHLEPDVQIEEVAGDEDPVRPHEGARA